MKLVAVVLAVGIWATGLAAQAPQKDTTIIDGYAHPELIPDMVVYRHWYQVASHSPQQAIRLQATGLSAADQAQLVKALNSFRVQWDALSANWDTQVKAANASGTQLDDTAYKQAKVDLVNQMNKEVQSLLSPAGWTQFQSYMQAHKRWMKISPGVTQ